MITVTFETRYLRGSNRTTGLVELDEVPITIDERIAALEANKTSIDIPMWRYAPPYHVLLTISRNRQFSQTLWRWQVEVHDHANLWPHADQDTRRRVEDQVALLSEEPADCSRGSFNSVLALKLTAPQSEDLSLTSVALSRQLSGFTSVELLDLSKNSLKDVAGLECLHKYGEPSPQRNSDAVSFLSYLSFPLRAGSDSSTCRTIPSSSGRPFCRS
jgi:hypothetical protein